MSGVVHARSHVQAAVHRETVQRWFEGALPDDEIDKKLKPSQRNGPRYRYIFDRDGAGWKQIARLFTRATGIDSRVPAWEFANDVDDGWPSSFLSDDDLLPINWAYFLAWVPGLASPIRVEYTASPEVWWGGNQITQPSDLLEMILEEDFAEAYNRGEVRRCWRCGGAVLRRRGVWVDETDGDACDSGVHEVNVIDVDDVTNDLEVSE